MLYPGCSLVNSFPSSEIQSVYSEALGDWAHTVVWLIGFAAYKYSGGGYEEIKVLFIVHFSFGKYGFRPDAFGTQVLRRQITKNVTRLTWRRDLWRHSRISSLEIKSTTWVQILVDDICILHDIYILEKFFKSSHQLWVNRRPDCAVLYGNRSWRRKTLN